MNIIRKWKIHGTVEVKARSGRPRKISDGMVREMNPHITAKKLQKTAGNTGLAVYRTTGQQYNVLQTTKTYMAELQERMTNTK